MENEIMEIANNEVDVVENISTECGKGWKIAGGIGLAILTGVITYKIGKKIVAVIKAKKAAKEEVENTDICVEASEVVSEEETK